MKDNLKFTELGTAYSLNLYNLNEARKVFEEECRQINALVEDLVKDHKSSHNTDKSKFLAKIFTWGNIDPWCTLKEGNWTSFVQGTTSGMNIRIPGRQKFENNIAFLRFEITFSDDLRRFVFRAKFENKYTKNELIDEKVIEMASKRPTDFPGSKLIKSSTGILCVWELDQNLINNLNFIVNNCMGLIEEAICELYPQSLYSSQSLEVATSENEQDVA